MPDMVSGTGGRSVGDAGGARPMRSFRKLALGASVLVLALSACSTGGSGATIKIGSDDFAEANGVAEIYAQALEAKGFTADRAGIGPCARAATLAGVDSTKTG